MDFDLTAAQKELKKDLSLWLKEEAKDLDLISQKDLKVQKEAVRGFLKKLGRKDCYFPVGLNPEESRKNPFAETLTWVFLAEELARISPSLFVSIEQSTRLFGWLISRYGPEPYCQELLAPLQKGMLLGAMAMAESSRNFPDKEAVTQARKEGEAYRLSGQKRQIINAPLADWLAVTGKTEGQWAVFLVKSDQAGLLKGEPQKTLGFNGLALSDLTLHECLVPEEQVIGPFPNPNFLAELQTRTNLIMTVASLGIMDRALQGVKQYASETQAGSKPLRAYQTISFKLAEMFTLFQTSQWMVYRAAWMLEAQAAGAETMAAATKVFVTEAAETMAKEALQIMGGEGFLAGHSLEECYRDARFGPVSGDTSEALRLRIAEDCLAKYR
jgi:alkylation response protein AidB-like acyl-CoA dehydrogenase